MTQLPSHSQHRREESERMIVLIPLFQINSKSHNNCRMLTMTSPYLCYLWAAFPNDTSDDFIGHSHLVSLMGAPAPTSSPRQRCQSWNGHISDILFFQVFYFFRYYSICLAPHLQGREPRGQIRLIRSIRWCWWDRRQPAREAPARPSPSVHSTVSSRHQG